MSPGDAKSGGPEADGGPPDVSVVLISYNDAERLPRALRSLQRQTLRAIEIIVVDDASTDGTADVVARFAAADPRIRYECLEQNSGGCSAPRNVGLGLARAPWVMFCDSDDEYERHACKNLLETAERHGADVVCGAAERIDTRTGRTRRWRPEVHGREQVVDGLAALPELLYDTISVNKIYRRGLLIDVGIRFPEGLLFEDQLFTLEAMAASSRLAVIPQTVYHWYVDRLSDEPSITQRRSEARNVESRIEVNRRIDAFLEARGLDRIREVKDLKFLQHDLYLYLASMLELDDETATVLVDRLVPYVSQTNLVPAWQVRTALRVAIYHLLVRDLEGIRSAMRFVKWASVVDVPIVARDGREWWGCAHLDDGPSAGGIEARRWLDVTDLAVLSVPFTQRRYLHRLDSFEVAAGTVTATGSTVDYDGSVAAVPRLELLLRTAGDRPAVTVPATWTGWEGRRRTWRVEGRPTGHLRRELRERDRGTVAVALRTDAHVNVTGVRAPEASVGAACLPYPGPARWTGPDAVELLAHDSGAVGWRARQTSRVRGRVAGLQESWLRIPGARRLATVWGLVRRDWVPASAARVARMLPDRSVVLLEASGGRGFSGGVAAVGAALADSDPGMSVTWVHRSEPALVPHGGAGVERSSLRHAWLQARARVAVTDGAQPLAFAPPRRCLVVNAGAGVPVHRIGLDDPSVLVSRSAVASVRRRAGEWDVLMSASEASAEVLRGAFGYRGIVACTGLPGMDAPIGELDAAGRRGLRERLDLPTDRAVVVHLAAERPDDPEEPLIDPQAWADRLGSRAYLVLRASPPTPTRLRAAIRDVSGAGDPAALIAASDLVISDYSSLIGDALLLDRPVILFQPDRETYVNRTRGLYPGLEAVGPAVERVDQLLDQVGRWLDDPEAWDLPHASRRRAWAAHWCGPADGRSTSRALAAAQAALESG